MPQPSVTESQENKTACVFWVGEMAFVNLLLITSTLANHMLLGAGVQYVEEGGYPFFISWWKWVEISKINLGRFW